MKFRDDINALRALAVLAVVLFHFKVRGWAGGFFGVDVFFVISGYLMTRIVVDGLVSGRFSYWGFVRARARRIVPALLVLVGTLLGLIGWLTPPSDVLDLGRQSQAALLFFSNLHFAAGQGYFSDGSDGRWLLHTWSLSVEWQFYMLYPLALWTVHRLVRRRGPAPRDLRVALRWPLAVAGAVSLIACILQSRLGSIGAFFELPYRAWEMIAGGLVCVAQPQGAWRSRLSKRHVQTALGALLPAMVYLAGRGRWEDQWPGALALWPVAWTVAFLLAGCLPGEHARWVSARPTQAVGRWSYSIYLWHWPIVVALKAFPWIATSPTAASVVGIAGATLAGWASYRWVEQPFQHSKPAARAVTAGRMAAGAAFGLVFATALFFVRSDGWPQRLGPDAAVQARMREAGDTPLLPEACLNYKVRAVEMADCVVHPELAGRAVLFYGDSHAQHFYPWMERHAQVRVDFFTAAGCPPIPGTNRSRPGYWCREIADAASRKGLEPAYDTIIVSGNWNALLGASQTERETALDGLREQWRRWLDAGKYLIVVEHTPEAPFNVPRVLARAAYLRQTERVGASAVVKPNPDFARLLAAFESVDRFHAVSLNEQLCHAGTCRLVDAAGYPIFKDRDHFSARWSRDNAFVFGPFVQRAGPVAAIEPHAASSSRELAR